MKQLEFASRRNARTRRRLQRRLALESLEDRVLLNGHCVAPANPVVQENCLPGNAPSEWDISGAGDLSIQGFATDISVDQGQTIHFKVKSDAKDYRIDIYRLGYYGSLGARKVAVVEPSVGLPQKQPDCKSDTSTGLIDCGNWVVSASWTAPADAVSGVYIAKLVREQGPAGASHIVFIVRDDDGRSNVLFQTSDTTWQAYNSYGGNSLYVGGPGSNPSRAYKVSYNRPFNTRAGNPQDWLFNAEYPMIRWLEANGYNVSYFAGVDSHRLGAELLEHRVFLSVGHDEYGSAAQRDNVEAARNAGVHLAFFSGNEVFWKTRWENSVAGANTPFRTLVSYKETHNNAKIDPDPAWTGTWRDPRFSPPSDGGRPENALSGQLFMVNEPSTTAIRVPEPDSKMRFWRNTSVATLAPGETATLADGTLGYEWDIDSDNRFRPPGLIRMSTTTVSAVPVLQDHGSTYATGTATHNLTLYRHGSGALVFGAGTIQWSWGLDGNHDRGVSTPDVRMQQATVNLLADMGVQPATLQVGLVAATASSDMTAPKSSITSPTEGATVVSGQTVTITGAASDTGGRVGGVEVSVDGGATWRRATGRATWSYSWTPTTTGSITIKSRAADDSGNLETPSAGVTVTVASRSCPCTIWASTATPQRIEEADTNAVEVGVKFRSDVDGFIAGLRFYKGSTNTGTHVGNLWTRTGALLASVTFTNETASGWQQASLASPVAITANTTYVASYHTSVGRYAVSDPYFTTAVDKPPLHALKDGADGGNGVFKYGASGFPTETFNSSNYWVEVVFTTDTTADTTPPAVSVVSPADGASGVSTGTNVVVTFSEAMDPATINTNTFQLRDAANALVSATVTYDGATRTATLDPADLLANSATYTAIVKGGTTDPRVKDTAGNALAANQTWSFTTVAASDTGLGGPILLVTTASNPFTRYYSEILRTEGLNTFTIADVSQLSSTTLSAHDVVILGEMPLTAAQVTMLTDWVNAGGNLIAMRPDKRLASLLGLTEASSTLSNAYLLVNTSATPGAGLVDETIQFHGTADTYTLNGATSVATLYATAATPTLHPAVTLRSVGTSGGQAAAFTYDLARSVVYTRQGNPAWAGQDRDGKAPIRTNDLFYGTAVGDPQPDWIDLNKAAIPQADEQQRLLANLIHHMNLDNNPLPRFWYFPHGKKAVVVMTGDDHGNGGTAGRFDQYKSLGIRSTSYIYPAHPMTDTQAAGYTADGFEIALHVDTGCTNWTPASLESFYNGQLGNLRAAYPSLPAPATVRTHCAVWSDYDTQPRVELDHSIRLDANYYYWPPDWVLNRPGMFTGSGMLMRFAALDGSIINVYQAATQMTDESGQSYPFTSDTLLDRALGPQGYYGAFAANAHTDQATSTVSDAIVSSARARNVPIVSARQMLNFLDGRNSSSFGSLVWNATKLTLSFSVTVGAGATGLQAMVPTRSLSNTLARITRDGSPISHSVQTIKGIDYAFLPAVTGSYVAHYDATPPTVSISDPAGGAAVAGTITVSANASDNVGVVGVQFLLDGAALGAEDTSAPYAISWDTTTASNGSHNLTARARDSAGNDTTSSAVTVTVANETVAPTVSISSPTSGAVVAGAITVSADASDNVGVVGVQFILDGAALGAEDTTAPYGISWDTTTATNGSHKLTARARDAAGNTATSSIVTVTVDNAAPSVIITSPSNGAVVSGTITVSADASDNFGVAGVQFLLDGANLGAEDTVAPYAVSWNTTTTSNGPHTLTARARDAAGNQTTSSEVTVTVFNALLRLEERPDLPNVDTAFHPVATGGAMPMLTSTEMEPLVAEAIAQWAVAGVDTAQLGRLRDVEVQIVDLAGPHLGLATATGIWIDRNAARYGWFVDPSPSRHEEFRQVGREGELRAGRHSPAFGRVDLLSVLAHELGHVLGLEHSPGAAHDVMAGGLPPGVRRLAVAQPRATQAGVLRFDWEADMELAGLLDDLALAGRLAFPASGGFVAPSAPAERAHGRWPLAIDESPGLWEAPHASPLLEGCDRGRTLQRRGALFSSEALTVGGTGTLRPAEARVVDAALADLLDEGFWSLSHIDIDPYEMEQNASHRKML